jgi:hypothetical protein
MMPGPGQDVSSCPRLCITSRRFSTSGLDGPRHLRSLPSMSMCAHFRLVPGRPGARRNEEVKSMDRLSRALAGGSLAVVLGTLISAAGCRSMRNDVPPGKPYSTTGGAPPTVGFSSDARANTGVGGGLYPGGSTPGSPAASGNPAMAGSGGAPAQYGIPGTSPGLYGTPSSNRYGAPGTNSGSSQ